MLWLWGSTFSRLLDGNPIEVDGSYAGGNEEMEAGAGAVFSAGTRKRVRGDETSPRGEGESEGTPTSEETLPLLLSRGAAGGIRIPSRLGTVEADAVSWLSAADTKTRHDDFDTFENSSRQIKRMFPIPRNLHYHISNFYRRFNSIQTMFRTYHGGGGIAAFGLAADQDAFLVRVESERR